MKSDKVRLFSYNANSESGKLLADALGVLRIRHEGSTFVGDKTHTVVNWGCSPSRFAVKGHGFKIINNPNAVYNACNKLRFFEACTGKAAPNIPEWTTDDKVAKKWLFEVGSCVIGRQKLEGMGGEGIVIMEGAKLVGNVVDFTPCKLYTKYIEKEKEFRLYIVRTPDGGYRMVDFCQKKRKYSESPKNWKIRSRENGFVFCWVGLNDLPTECILQSIKAIDIIGLDMGGVDVIFNQETGKAFVLEVNTAPWLSEDTADKLAAAIKELIV